jgi:endonuclease YncB( thermonuclease family)
MEPLLSLYNNETPFFSLKGLKTYARVVNVIDGDTISLIIPIFDDCFKFYVRLSGIDTCEIHSINEENKEKGLKAKYRVIELICKNKKITDIICITKKQIIEIFDKNVYTVWIECEDFDKYGRLLAKVYLELKKNGVKSIGEILIEENLGYKYEGNTKLSEEEQIKILQQIKK